MGILSALGLMPKAGNAAIDVVKDGASRLLDLIPEGDSAKRAAAQKIVSGLLTRMELENSGDLLAQRIRAATRPILTIGLDVAWCMKIAPPPVDIMGHPVTLGTLAVLATVWWFCERGLLGLFGGK